jgi:hypothetical protein
VRETGDYNDEDAPPLMEDWFVPSRVTGSFKEYAVAYADGTLSMFFRDEQEALGALQDARDTLKSLGIPEEYHPVLMERTVETVYGSWQHRSE